MDVCRCLRHCKLAGCRPPSGEAPGRARREAPHQVPPWHSSMSCVIFISFYHLYFVFAFLFIFCLSFMELWYCISWQLGRANPDMASRLQAPVGRRPRQGPPGGPARWSHRHEYFFNFFKRRVFAFHILYSVICSYLL